MKLQEIIQQNMFAILMAVGGAAAAGFLLYMDNRHDMRGQAAKAATVLEMRNLRREIREKEAYELTDPGSKYSQARMMLIQEMKDDLAELEQEAKEE